MSPRRSRLPLLIAGAGVVAALVVVGVVLSGSRSDARAIPAQPDPATIRLGRIAELRTRQLQLQREIAVVEDEAKPFVEKRDKERDLAGKARDPRHPDHFGGWGAAAAAVRADEAEAKVKAILTKTDPLRAALRHVEEQLAALGEKP